MTIVKKKNRTTSVSDLMAALDQFIYLLEGQDEEAAVAELKLAKEKIQENTPGTSKFQEAIQMVLEAFDGEHELQAYTIRRDKSDASNWTEVEELYLTSVSVLNLAKRLK